MSNATVTIPRIIRRAGTVQPPISAQRWEEWMANRDAARDSNNWDDKGNWIESKQTANAFDIVTARSTALLLFEWPSVQCVDKFRRQSQQVAARLCFLQSDIMGSLLHSDWIGGMGVSLLGTFLLDQVTGTTVHAGWSYGLKTELEVHLGAHPWGKRELNANSMQAVFNENKKIHRKIQHQRKIDLNEFSDEILFRLLQSVGNREGNVTRIICPDVGALARACSP